MDTDTPRARLQALRDHFAARLEAAEDRDATAMGRLLRDIDADLAALPDGAEVSSADEIAERRTARRANSSGGSRSKRSS